MTDEKTRVLIAEAEKHQEVVVCGNPRHTNFDIGCPDCAVVCDYCTCPWPCDARRLADALEALTVPDGDAREVPWRDLLRGLPDGRTRMTTITEYLAEQKRLAEAQQAACARMIELNGGVGMLGVRHPEMFEDMMAWQEATENEHADTVLPLIAALEAVMALNTGDNRRLYGNDFEAGMAKALWMVHSAIEAALGGETDG